MDLNTIILKRDGLYGSWRRGGGEGGGGVEEEKAHLSCSTNTQVKVSWSRQARPRCQGVGLVISNPPPYQ